MSSRSKKKRLWREEKERKYNNLKEGYDRIINNLEKIKNFQATVTGTVDEKEWAKIFEDSQ